MLIAQNVLCHHWEETPSHYFLECFLYSAEHQALFDDFKHFSFHKKNKKKITPCELKPHAKFQNPRTTPSGRKVTQVERRNSGGYERRRERKNALNSGNLFQCSKPLGLIYSGDTPGQQ